MRALVPEHLRFPYLLALGLIGVAILVTRGVDQLAGHSPFLLPVGAVMIASWSGGLGPGLVATVIGILGTNYLVLDQSGPPDVTDKPLLQVGAYCSVALLVSWLNEARRRAQEESHNTATRLRLLAELGQRLTETGLDLTCTVDTAVSKVASLGDACVLSLLATDGVSLSPHGASYRPDNAQIVPQIERALQAQRRGEGFMGEAVEHGHPKMLHRIHMAEIIAVTGTGGAEPIALPDAMISALIVPLRAGRRVLGALMVWRSSDRGSYVAADLEFLEDLASTVALAIENARLHEHTLTAEARFRGLFNGVPDAIFVTDADGRIKEVNPAVTSTFGFQGQELTGRSIGDLVTETALRRGGVEGAAPFHRSASRNEFELRHKDGQAVPVESHTHQVDLPEGAAIVTTVRDVSERHDLERLRADFLASISHDLRTPLTAVRAGIGLLQESLSDRISPDERALLSDTRRSTEHLGRLIDDLISMRDLDAGALVIERRSLDLCDIVADVLSILHPLLEQRGQSLELDLSAPLEVEGDPRRLGQVILNLLSNAHEHTPGGTTIVITGSVGDEVLLTVADTGPGIPDRQVERVFERYHRSDAHGDGAGLGLPLARGIVELHGGRLWATCPQAGGAAFHVALPRPQGSATG